MDSNYHKNLNRIKHNKKIKIFLGSNFSLYFSFIVWFIMTFWDRLIENKTFTLYLLNATTAGIATAYLLFTWLFYIYVRYTDSLVSVLLSLFKLSIHVSLILLIFSYIF